jgi:hypothetical protein
MKSKTKFQLRILIGAVGYVLGIVVFCHFYTGLSPYKNWLVLLPVFTTVYYVAANISYVAELDEMWRKMITEAAAFSGIATGFTCFSYVFFRDIGAPEFHAQWAFCMMWVYYGIGLVFSWRRYR